MILFHNEMAVAIWQIFKFVLNILMMGVFSFEDKIIIRYLRHKYGYGAKRIVADHPEKDWKWRVLNDLLKKINETDEIDRKKGSGRPRTA